MTLKNVSANSEAPLSLVATSDMFTQASSHEPLVKRLKLAPDCDAANHDSGPLQWYTIQTLQKVSLTSSPSEPLVQQLQKGVSEEPTKAPDSIACLGTQTELLDGYKDVVPHLPSSSTPLFQKPQKVVEPFESEKPITASDSLFVEPTTSDGFTKASDSKEAPKEDELPNKILPTRQLRTKRERGRRHVPGSCIDLTQSDEEGADGSAGTVEDPSPVQATREGLRETPAREEAHRWRQLEGKVCKYPPSGDDVMPIHGEELRCLAPGQFLNDTVIEFYIRWLQLNWPRIDLPQESCLFLNSFFYKKLKQLTSAQRVKRHPDGPDFHRLRRWTKGIHLLRKQYIFVPIHDLEHWTLAVVCFPEERALALPGDDDVIPTPAILHLDSLGTKHGGHNTASVTRQLKSYLAWEVLQQLAPPKDSAPTFTAGLQAGTRSHKPLAKARPAFTPDQIVVKRVPVPLQQNDYDCGLFLLHSLETFVKFAPATFRLSDLSATLQLGRAWYPSDAPSLRRFELLQMLHLMFGIEEEPSEVQFVGTQAQAMASSTSTSPKQEVACQTEAVIALRADELSFLAGAEVVERAEAGHVQPISPEPLQAPIGISTGSELEAASPVLPCKERREPDLVEIVQRRAALEVAGLISPKDRDLGQHREAVKEGDLTAYAMEALGSIQTVAGPLVLQERQVAGMTDARAGDSKLKEGLEGTAQQSQRTDQLLAAKQGEEKKENRIENSKTKSNLGRSSTEGQSFDVVYFDAQLAFDASSSQPDLSTIADQVLSGENSTRATRHDTQHGAFNAFEEDESDVEEDIDVDSLGALGLISQLY